MSSLLTNHQSMYFPWYLSWIGTLGSLFLNRNTLFHPNTTRSKWINYKGWLGTSLTPFTYTWYPIAVTNTLPFIVVIFACLAWTSRPPKTRSLGGDKWSLPTKNYGLSMKILIFLSIMISFETFSRYGGGFCPFFFIYSIYFPLNIFSSSPKFFFKFSWSFLAYSAFWAAVFFSFYNIFSNIFIFYKST